MTATLSAAKAGFTQRWLGAAIVGAAAAVAFLIPALESDGRPRRVVVWGSLALAVYLVALFCLVAGHQGRGLGLTSWKLGPWTLMWGVLAFGLATITWRHSQEGTPAQIALTSVLDALWMIAVASTAWVVGYLIGPGTPMSQLCARGVSALGRSRGLDVRSSAAPWLLYGVGLAARLVSTATTGRFGYVGDASSAVSTASGYGQIFSALSLCAPLAIAAAALQVFRERVPGARITLAALFAIELVLGAAAGGKESFIIAILAVVIPFSAVRRRLPAAALVLAALLFLVVVVPFNQAYRDVARSGSTTLGPGAAVTSAPSILRDVVDRSLSIRVVESSFNFMLQRVREIDSPAIVLQRTPDEIAYRRPVELVEAPVADIVPRAVWPGKPILSTGYEFSQDYFGLPSTVYSSSAITPQADLFRHGGWGVLGIGMVVLGCGVRLLDDTLDVRTNTHAIMLVLLLFPSIVKGEQDWVTLFAGIPSTLVIWVAAVLLTFRPVAGTDPGRSPG